jgi:hypothetical protein
VQQLRRSVAALLLHAFALRAGVFFASGTFSFCFDVHSLFLQASGAVWRDLDGPGRAAAGDPKEAPVVERTRRDAMRAAFVHTVFAPVSDPPQQIELGDRQVIRTSSHCNSRRR